eukprot:c11570_g2_i1 orf=3-443(-)
MVYRRLLLRLFTRPQSSCLANHKLFFCTKPPCFSSSNQEGDFQRTISKAISRSGIGLHTGTLCYLKLLPAAAGEGRYFVYLAEGSQKQDEEVRVPASIHSVKDTTLSTCIGEGQVKVQTVEHLLSALEGLGVDNCRIEIKGGIEVPL